MRRDPAYYQRCPMPSDPIWRNHDDLLDATPAVLHEEVLGDAERWSDRVALLDAATGRSLAYGELVAQARRFAAGLRGRGAAGGDVLALVAGNTPEYAVVAHGTLSAGLTLAPASPLLTARELRAFLRQTGARYALADVAALPKVTEAATAAGVDEVFGVRAEYLRCRLPRREAGANMCSCLLWSASCFPASSSPSPPARARHS
jgi:acyl-coenzyme A synthetase/AMP-(fatty) acid ligase